MDDDIALVLDYKSLSDSIKSIQTLMLSTNNYGMKRNLGNIISYLERIRYAYTTQVYNEPTNRKNEILDTYFDI